MEGPEWDGETRDLRREENRENFLRVKKDYQVTGSRTFYHWRDGTVLRP